MTPRAPLFSTPLQFIQSPVQILSRRQNFTMATSFDSYRLQYQPEWTMEQEVGRGGFGVVYQEQIRRPGMFRSELCAVKKIPLGIVDVAADLRRYKREIAILTSLVHHEWFVQFFGWHETKYSIFIAMEYMELGDLGNHLGVPWSENDTKVVAKQLLKGLTVLHEAGIAHRDLKPQNVFPILLDDGCLRIKIGDFGVSKSVTSNTNTSLRTIINVPGYTAPELMGCADSYTNAVDLWSLGCLAYRMISGENLFCTLDDIYRYKYNVISFPRARLTTLGLSSNGANFIESLLHCNPQHRPTAQQSLSCSWISFEALGNRLSSAQVERLQNQVQSPRHPDLENTEIILPQLGQAILENTATPRPQHAPQLEPEASSLDHSASSGDSNAAISIAFSQDRNCLAYAPFCGADDGKLWDPSMVACQATLVGHSGWVRSVAFSPDGKRIASGSSDYHAILWDLSTRAYQAILVGHSNTVYSVAFSHDGKYLATGSYDRKIKLWDTSTGKYLVALKHDKAVNSVAFSPDGKRIASGAFDGTIKHWDLATQACQANVKGNSGWIYAIAFSPDGTCLACESYDYTVMLSNPSTGECRVTLQGHSSAISSVAFSSDGNRLATASADETIKVWDSSTGACQVTLNGHSLWVNSVAFSPDGKCLASGSSDTSIKLWDSSTGECRAVLTGHSSWVYSVAFSPDGKCLASASKDHTIKLWGPLTAHCIKGHRQTLGPTH